MCDPGCDGFPSLDLVGNSTTQVSIPFMYLLFLFLYIYRWESHYPGVPETPIESQSQVLLQWLHLPSIALTLMVT